MNIDWSQYPGIAEPVPVTQHRLVGVLRDVVTIMSDIEAHYGQGGWDTTPMMFHSICRASNGTYKLGAYRVGQTGVPPHEELAFTATLFENEPPPPGVLADLYPAPLIGHMVTYEAWGLDLAPGVEQIDRHPADTPGGYEKRTVLAVLGRRHLMLTRKRGQEPTIAHWHLGDTPMESGGIHHSLTRIDKAARRLVRERGMGDGRN